jgi:beta-glucuronidase
MLYPVQNGIRNRLDLSGIWDFQTDPDETGEENGWFRGLPSPRPVSVPGSWNEQYEDLQNYLGLSWYFKRTFVPSGWKGQRIFLRVGSANYFGTVYVNGARVGSHEGGHLPFAFEITDQIHWAAENRIAISVENHLKPTRVPSGNLPSPFSGMAGFLPTTFDFFPFAGLHRPVLLYTVPQTYIEDVVVVTGIDGPDGSVWLRVQLNSPAALKGAAHLAGGGSTWSASLAFENGAAEALISVPRARFWSDKDPYLYDLDLQVGEDHYSLQAGIRTIAVQEGQILLNGAPIKLNGFGRHEDFIASGRGLNLPLMVKDYQLMRWTGANSFRTSHYPYSEEDMQMADRQGFLVIDEIPAVSLQFDSDENVAERMRLCRQQIDELVRRDKNHPSVVMWSVANEPVPRNMRMAGAGSTTSALDPAEKPGKAFLETLMNEARGKDATRPVTFAAVSGGPLSWMKQCDVICMNRYWGWYVMGGKLGEALAMLERELDAVWDTWHKPVIMTEFGADTVAGMHGHPSMMWTEEYQAELIRGHLEVAARKPYIAGMQLWNFADFAAVQGIMRVGGLNRKGIFTRDRQPKMAAQVLREFWTRSQEQPEGTDSES